ncbi:hypothetical protein P7K49_029876 [Saguinus oedipus]|uniref:Uncharacterized protein n=1 Tax=Saguinus oedipus TaxID=9490 RepID=A0ABQ9U8G3_SAGOE|nr:hypothetical protein P7K49_029876 [Saguinus oedipus]
MTSVSEPSAYEREDCEKLLRVALDFSLHGILGCGVPGRSSLNGPIPTRMGCCLLLQCQDAFFLAPPDGDPKQPVNCAHSYMGNVVEPVMSGAPAAGPTVMRLNITSDDFTKPAGAAAPPGTAPSLSAILSTRQ